MSTPGRVGTAALPPVRASADIVAMDGNRLDVVVGIWVEMRTGFDVRSVHLDDRDKDAESRTPGEMLVDARSLKSTPHGLLAPMRSERFELVPHRVIPPDTGIDRYALMVSGVFELAYSRVR